MAPKSTGKRAVIYARLSVSSDESVSIPRQLESCAKYVEAQGWQVVGEPFVDDGVSATKNKPRDRAGFSALLASPDPYDVVVIWKLDRLARRVVDWHEATEELKSTRNASVVSVTESLDLSNPYGEFVASILAAFAQMEAATISARAAAARSYLLKNGRAVGGSVCYGYKREALPSPVSSKSVGYKMVKDSDRIGFVERGAKMLLDGHNLNQVVAMFREDNAPMPYQTKERKNAWSYTSLDRLYRNPILAGLTAYNPGNKGGTRGAEILRDEMGLPIVNADLAVVTVSEWRQIQELLDNKSAPQAIPRADRRKTPVLFSGLVTCQCGAPMNRGTSTSNGKSRASLQCKACYQTITEAHLRAIVEDRLLEERGDEHNISLTVTYEDDTVSLAEIENALTDATRKLTADDADVDSLLEQIAALKELRAQARNTGASKARYDVHAETVADEWAAATTDEKRREVLLGQVASITVKRGRPGPGLQPERVSIVWHDSQSREEAMQELYAQMQEGETVTAPNLS